MVCPTHVPANLAYSSTIDYREDVRYSGDLPTCPYCSAAPEDAWVCTEFVVALPHPSPLTPCHLIVAPRRHVAAFYDLDVQEQRMIWETISELCRNIAESVAAEGYDAGFVDAPVSGEPDFHAYLHLVPRVPGQRMALPSGAEWVDLGPQP